MIVYAKVILQETMLQHTQQLLLAREEGMAADFDFSHQVLTCQRSCGFVLKQTERLSMYHFQYVTMI